MEKLDADFWKATAKSRGQIIFSLLLMAMLFFLSAGTFDLPSAWFFFGLYFAGPVINILVFLKYNPEVITARSEIIKGEMKWWDKVFAVLYLFFMLAIPAVCGLDIRFGAPELPIEYYFAGILLFAVGWGFSSWALVVNKFFEGAVRIQKERGHKVITTGPYAIVRHPGYAGLIMVYLAMPFGLGSLYGLVPALLLAFAFVFRIHFEDEFLQKELEGYKEYSNKTKYRLIPFIW